MLETVDSLRWLTVAEHKFGLLKLGKCLFQCPFVAAGHLTYQQIGEFTPDGRSDLADLLHRRHAVKARHQ